MVGRGVIGHEVEQEAEVAAREPLAQPRQRRVSAEVVVDGVGGDGERRSGDVLVAQVGQHAPALLDHLDVGARDGAPRGAGLPDPEEPDPAEPAGGDLVEHGVVDVVERRPPPERDAALVQRHARVDLVQRRIGGQPHGWTPGTSRIRCCSRLRSARLTPGREQRLGPHAREERHQRGDDRRPPGLVAGAQAGAVVAVEVFVEKDVVLPVRIVDELARAAEDRTAAFVVEQEDAGHAIRQLLGDLVERHVLARAGRALDAELVAVERVHLNQRADDERVDRRPDRPAPVGVAAEHPGVGLGRKIADAVFAAAGVEHVRVLQVIARDRADAVVAQELVGVEHARQDTPQLVVGEQRQHAAPRDAGARRVEVGHQLGSVLLVPQGALDEARQLASAPPDDRPRPRTAAATRRPSAP